LQFHWVDLDPDPVNELHLHSAADFGHRIGIAEKIAVEGIRK